MYPRVGPPLSPADHFRSGVLQDEIASAFDEIAMKRNRISPARPGEVSALLR